MSCPVITIYVLFNGELEWFAMEASVHLIPKLHYLVIQDRTPGCFCSLTRSFRRSDRLPPSQRAEAKYKTASENLSNPSNQSP